MKIRNLLRWLLAIPVLALVFYLVAPPIEPSKAQLAAIQTWGGTATGSANAPTIVLHNVGAVGDLLGVPIRFLPSTANTGSTTLTITLDSGGSLGPINILKPSLSGSLVSMIGNEFQSGQIATVAYDGTQFECSGCTTTVPTGTIQDFSGLTVPAGWLKADGSAISRTTNSVLFNTLAFTSISATTTNGNATVTIPGGTGSLQKGWFIGGANVSCSTTISSISDGTHIVMAANATATGATTLTIGPYPQGDCATTFNIPNLTGRVTAMVDGSTNITPTTCPNAGSLGATCGGQTTTLVTGNLPPYTPTGTITNGAISVSGNAAANIGGSSTGGGGFGINAPAAASESASQGTSTFAGSAQGGTSTPLTTLPPVAMTYKIIKT